MLIQGTTLALEQNNRQIINIALRNDDNSVFSLTGLTYTFEIWVATPGGVVNSYGVGTAYTPLNIATGGLANAIASGGNCVLTFTEAVIEAIASNWGSNLVPYSTVYEALLLVSAGGTPGTYKFAKGTVSIAGSAAGEARP